MKRLTVVLAVLLIMPVPCTELYSSDEPAPVNKVFTKSEIKKIANVYVENNLGLKNPAIVDIDKDGDFDILIFNDGNVEYYKNTGTLEKPFFIPENMHYDKYTNTTLFIDIALSNPVFFADKNGDASPDMFVIKDKMYDPQMQTNTYNVVYAENVLGLDTGVLITIVLVLLIIVLVLAIL